MATYEITYLVTLEDTTPKQDGHSAVFWLERVIRNRDLELPEHVESVQTVPRVTLHKPKKVED